MTADEARIVSFFYGGTALFFMVAIISLIWLAVGAWKPSGWPLRALRFGIWPSSLFFATQVASLPAQLIWVDPADFSWNGVKVSALIFVCFVICGLCALGWIVYHSAFRPSVFNRTQKAPRQSNRVAAHHLASGWRWIWTRPIRWIARLTRAVKQEWDAASRD
jgi:hypothetical protein